MEPAYSAQFQGLESAIKVSSNMTFFYLRKYTRRDNIWIPKSAQNLFVHISENPIDSYDSNSVILIFISALGNEKWKLLFSLFTCSFSESPGRIRTYYISLERHFQGEYSAVGIVGNGSVGTELLEEQV